MNYSRLDKSIPANRLKIYVASYDKNPFSVSISLRLVLDEFETTRFTFVNIPSEELAEQNDLSVVKKKPKWYVKQAMKNIRKDIKDWIEEVLKEPSIVGEEVEIEDGFLDII